MDRRNQEYDLNKCVEEYRDEIIELAAQLVRIPSENIAPNGFEKACQEYLCGYLKAIPGIELDCFNPMDAEGIETHPAYRAGRNYTDRPNVVATKRDGDQKRSVIFSSHVDTVTKNPVPWQTGDPFSGKVVDGKLYGRGSFDMKGGLAATVMCLKIIAEKGLRFNGKVIVESIVDEENGGSNGTLAARLRGHNADVAIIPEPSLLDICCACKGGKQYKVSMGGTAGTGYGGEQVSNPVYGLGLLAASIAQFEKNINKDIRCEGSVYDGEVNPRTVILDKFQAGDLEPGGNIGIPDQAWFTVFINTLPGFTEEMTDREFNDFIDDIVDKNKALFPQNPQVTGNLRYLCPIEMDRDHQSIHALVKASKEFGLNNPAVTGAKFACDGYIFDQYFHTPAVVFGPRGGNAHAQDEYVLVEDLILLTKIYLRFILDWCR